jgi:DNA-binding CsgD family transcriptional regulator/transcriptional regulator with XRE-family HTH domain
VGEVESLADLAGLLRRLRREQARRRGKRELTYREIASRTGWAVSTISEYFTGRTLPPTDRFDVLVRLLEAPRAELGALATVRDRVADLQRGAAVRVPLDSLRLSDRPIVDREAELAGLHAAVKAAVAGSGGAVFLCGEAGIGKTRLVTEATRLAADAGLQALRGRAATPSVQFRALSEALLSVLRRSRRPDDPALLPYYPVLSRLVPEWRTGLTARPEDSLVVLAEAVLRLVVAVGRPGSLLVLEDLHDADQDTLAVVDYLVDNAATEPFLLLGTVRSQPSGGLDLMRAARRRAAVTVFGLHPLGDEAVRTMAGACLDVSPDQVPEPVVDRLLSTADGVPLHVEELLAGMVEDRLLVRQGRSWSITGSVAAQLPVTLAATLTGRVDRQSSQTRALLETAALLGRRFTPSPVGAAIGISDARLVGCLREAVEAQLLVADGEEFCFRHALTAEALRARLLPLEHAELARRVAQAMETHQIERTDGAEQLLAELWFAAGENRRAGEFLVAAGRRAAAEGALSTSISMLERALVLIDDEAAGTVLADIVSLLIELYAEAGRVADAYAIATRLGAGTPADQRAAIHALLGRVAAAAGDWDRCVREIHEARRLLGPAADPIAIAQLHVVAAQLLFGRPSPNGRAAARELAERALRVVDPHTEPVLACDAVEIMGRIVRLDDVAEADRLSKRGLAITEAHDLVGRRIRMLYHLGVHDGVRDGDPTRLLEALDVANRAGAVLTALDVELELSVVRLCRGEFDLVEAAAARCEQAAARLRLAHSRLLALGVRIMAAAHHARRSLMDELLDQFNAAGGAQLDFASAVHGFGVAFCHLLHEDVERAHATLNQAAVWESTRPATYVSYVHGPHLLLSVLADPTRQDTCVRLTESPHMQARWNRQFLVLTEAFLHARAGRTADADQAVSRFIDLSQRFPLAQHLGLRLVAPIALEGGWGQPVPWLRSAEAYFHPFAPDVAHACRRLLRAAGAPAPQHRKGSDAVPAAAWRLGITVREHEVLRLVAEHLSNPDIARRLYLSTRTVEKHIANLLAKTASTHRAQLITIAAELSTASAR